MEMVSGMMPDQGLSVFSPHQAVQTMVDRSLQSLDLVEGLQKEVPLLKESADLRLDSPNGLQGPQIPWSVPQRLDDVPSQEARREPPRHDAHERVHSDGPEIQLHEPGAVPKHPRCIQATPGRNGISLQPAQSLPENIEGRGVLRNRWKAQRPWHFLYFLPEPQGQGSLGSTFFSTRTGSALGGGGGGMPGAPGAAPRPA